jgi:hypothetical protein
LKKNRLPLSEGRKSRDGLGISLGMKSHGTVLLRNDQGQYHIDGAKVDNTKVQEKVSLIIYVTHQEKRQ